MGAPVAGDLDEGVSRSAAPAGTHRAGVGCLSPDRRAGLCRWHGRALIAPPFYHDGTERPIGRPLDEEEQEIYYSGKRKDHTLKNVLVVDEEGYVRFLSATYEGKAHDKRIADEAQYQLPEGSQLAQDTAFQGFSLPEVTILQPKKKPPKGSLTPEEKAENQRISAIRVHIEHSIGSVKIYRIVHDVIRHWCPWIRDQVMYICCGLHNLRLRQRMADQVTSQP